MDMNTLGLRASPTEVTFCVYDTVKNVILNVEEIRIPNALNMPEKLKYLRATILDVLREYQIIKAGIRLTEHSAMSSSPERIQIEGVLQEAFASSTLKNYFQGALVTIASKLSTDKTTLFNLIKTSSEYDAIDNWCDFNVKEREAILVALGAINV
jgi:hypothetical protein